MAVVNKNVATFDSRAILEVYMCHGVEDSTPIANIDKLTLLLSKNVRYPKTKTVKLPKITDGNLTENSEFPKK